MKNKVIAVGILICLLGSSLTSTAFAANECQTCSTTAPLIDQYMKFSYEIISTLQTLANEKQRETVQNNSTDVLTRIANNLNQKWQTIVTFNVLMSTIGTQIISSSARQEIAVMVNSKALMRDREKLDQLDQDISDTLFDLGQAGAFIANLQEYQQRASAIIKKYADQDGSFIEITGEPSPSASELIGGLWDLNQAYKRFIAEDKTDGFDVFSEKHGDTLWIQLTRANYESLQEQYNCTRGINKCDETYKKFGDNVSETLDGAQWDADEAVATIKTSLERLKCAFSKQSSVKCQKLGFREKQNDLLRNLYGIEWPFANQQGTSALSNSMSRLGDSFAREVNDVKDFYTKNDNQQSSITLPSKWLLDISTPDFATKKENENLYASLVWVMNSTLAQSKSSRQSHVLADPLVVTRNIPRTSIVVYSAINIIGDPQKAKSITQNLGKACENQCSNLWWTCYY